MQARQQLLWRAQAFNATKDFENHALIAFLESIGAEFGACSNAYTSADETVREPSCMHWPAAAGCRSQMR